MRVVLSVVFLVGVFLSQTGYARRTRVYRVQQYTFCSCGASPVVGNCRMTVIQRADKSTRFEDRKSLNSSGACDVQTCGKLFSLDYGADCADYVPGKPFLTSASEPPLLPDPIPEKPAADESEPEKLD